LPETRQEAKVQEFLGRDQYGFRSGRGTRDAIAALRVLYERSLEFNNKVYTCYVDSEKAFDRTDWTKLLSILPSIGVDWRDRWLIWNLYNGQSFRIRIDEGLSHSCSAGRGVRQGCSRSPLLYLIYDEAMVKEAFHNAEYGITVGGQVVNMIRYAVDKAVVSNSQKSLQHLMDNLNSVKKDYGMRINVKKTKVMCISRKGITKMKIYIDRKRIDQVTQFRYLGSLITEHGYCEKEIRSRIGMAKKIFQNKKELFI